MDTPPTPHQHARSSSPSRKIWSRLSSKLRIMQATQSDPPVGKAYLAPLLVLDNPEMITQLPLISQITPRAYNSRDRSLEKSRKRLSWPLLRPTTDEKKPSIDNFTKKLRSWGYARSKPTPSKRGSCITLYSEEEELADEEDTVSEGSSSFDPTLVDSPQVEENSHFLGEICQMSLAKLKTAPRSMEQLLFIHLMLVKCNRNVPLPESFVAATMLSKDEKKPWWTRIGPQKDTKRFYEPDIPLEPKRDLLLLPPKFLELPQLGLDDLWTEASRRVEESQFVHSVAEEEDPEDTMPLEVVKRRSLCAAAPPVEPDMGKRLESLQTELLSIFNF